MYAAMIEDKTIPSFVNIIVQVDSLSLIKIKYELSTNWFYDLSIKRKEKACRENRTEIMYIKIIK